MKSQKFSLNPTETTRCLPHMKICRSRHDLAIFSGRAGSGKNLADLEQIRCKYGIIRPFNSQFNFSGGLCNGVISFVGDEQSDHELSSLCDFV